MALSKEFDPKNGFMGGINIKPMGIKNNTPAREEAPKAEPAVKEEKKAVEVKPEKKVETKEATKPKKETKAPAKKEKAVDKKPAVEKEVEEVSVNKGGRPKKYDVEKVRTTLFFPEDLLDEIEIAKIKFNGSRTDYIIDLVRKDLEKNKAEYDTLKKIFKK